MKHLIFPTLFLLVTNLFSQIEDVNGNVGIGTSSPSAKLHIIDQSNSSATSLQLNNRIKFRGDGVMNWGASADYGILSWNTQKVVIGGMARKDLSLLADGGERMIVKKNGNIGIGISNPSSKIHINSSSSSAIRVTRSGSNTFGYEIGGTTFGLYDYSRGEYKWRTQDNNVFITENSGSVGIGTTTTGSHKLAVDGSIGAREIKVEIGTWSDFVFYKDYQLPTLKEVENHITEKGHLKGIPSAKEVEENGINLGEMNAKLLQKIEELTLYALEQEKKLNTQNKVITKQQQEIQSLKLLEQRLDKIEESIKHL